MIVFADQLHVICLYSAIVFEEVSSGFDKLRKAVRTGVKASQSHNNLNGSTMNSNSNAPNSSKDLSSSSMPSTSQTSNGSIPIPNTTSETQNQSSQPHNESLSSLDKSSLHLTSPSSGHSLETSGHSNSSVFQVPTQEESTSTLPTTSQLRKTGDERGTSKTALCPMSMFMVCFTITSLPLLYLLKYIGADIFSFG